MMTDDPLRVHPLQTVTGTDFDSGFLPLKHPSVRLGLGTRF
jgi:hypothetical protein